MPPVGFLEGVEELLILAPEGVHGLVLDELGEHLLELLLDCLELVVALVRRHGEARLRPGEGKVTDDQVTDDQVTGDQVTGGR